MLDVVELRAWRGRTPVLFSVSLKVDAGETLALVGANGAGKTSTMTAIMGGIRSEGTVRLGEVRIDRLTTLRRSRAGISLVPEGRRLFPGMTVRENLVVGLRRSELPRLDAILAVFPRLEGKLARRITDLSGGEQQMVAIGRSLLRTPKVLLLDEPSLGLAPGVIADLYRLLSELQLRGTTMVLAESSIPRASEIANRLCLIKSGVSERTVFASDHAAVAELKVAALGGTADVSES
jgi:branched-chain amino acid transport system ATP-binding protein